MSTPQRLDLTFRIEWQGDWHAGSGEESAACDRHVRRRLTGSGIRMPLLPGSQLKGVLRHQCERLAALLGFEVVPPHQVGHAGSAALLGNFAPLRQSALLIDRLFGTRYQGDCLFVDDALPETPSATAATADPWPSRAHARTAIDRLTRTARDRTLFVSEVVAGRDCGLRGRIRARHPAGVLSQYDGGFPLEYALLLAGLQTLDSLGGDRSSGMGRCTVAVVKEELRWNGCRISLESALASFAERDWKLMLDLAREEGSS